MTSGTAVGPSPRSLRAYDVLMFSQRCSECQVKSWKAGHKQNCGQPFLSGDNPTFKEPASGKGKPIDALMLLSMFSTR